MSLELISGLLLPDQVLPLFEAYTKLLVQNDPSFAAYLEQQHFSEECRHLEKKYGPPDGRLILALWDGVPAGCVALQRLDAQNGELKRLYVKPEYRGRAIAKQLLQAILAEAKSIGYAAVLLDTLPFLQSAIHLYRAWGFVEIPRYNESPMADAIYMKLDLTQQDGPSPSC